LFKRTHCGNSVCPEQKMKACLCKIVWYCSTNCQRQHWKKDHKPDRQRILERAKRRTQDGGGKATEEEGRQVNKYNSWKQIKR
jgi:thiosulfate reductase cytochrome b subunit